MKHTGEYRNADLILVLEGLQQMRSNEDPTRRGIKVDLESDHFLLEFDTPAEDFMRGFECGEIWACLADGVESLRSIISASNALMVMRMADATGYSFEAFELPPSAVEVMKLGPGDWMTVLMRRPNE
jgi:hypothetical protein